MKKSSKIILNIVAIISLEILFCVCGLRPIHLVGEYNSVPAVFFNIIFWAMYALILTVIFSKGEAFFAENLFKRIGKRALIKNFALLLALQIVFDVLLMLAEKFPLGEAYIYEDALLVFRLLAAYALIAEKNTAVWKSAKRGGAFCAVTLLAAAALALWDFAKIAEYGALSEKYVASSPYMAQALSNMNLLHMFKQFIAEAVVLCAFAVIHLLGTAEVAENEREQSGGVKLFIRATIMPDIAALTALIMVICFPQNLMIYLGSRGFERIGYEEKGGCSFYEESAEVQMGMDNESARVLYSMNKIYLYKGDMPEVCFEFNPKAALFVQGADAEGLGNEYEFRINSEPVYVYGNFAIFFYENGAPKIVRVDELSEQAENAVITEICKKLIEEGNLFAFEYGVEYLSVYEREFITPYIERYAAGDFTASERGWMEASYYREDFIVNLAKRK